VVLVTEPPTERDTLRVLLGGREAATPSAHTIIGDTPPRGELTEQAVMIEAAPVVKSTEDWLRLRVILKKRPFARGMRSKKE
jgi:hypothetical protein